MPLAVVTVTVDVDVGPVAALVSYCDVLRRLAGGAVDDLVGVAAEQPDEAAHRHADRDRRALAHFAVFRIGRIEKVLRLAGEQARTQRDRPVEHVRLGERQLIVVAARAGFDIERQRLSSPRKLVVAYERVDEQPVDLRHAGACKPVNVSTC